MNFTGALAECCKYGLKLASVEIKEELECLLEMAKGRKFANRDIFKNKLINACSRVEINWQSLGVWDERRQRLRPYLWLVRQQKAVLRQFHVDPK
jgi:hypothetical protein